MKQELWLLAALVVLWGDSGAGAPWGPTRCIPIPPAMALCHNIGYTEMRLPNLLDHDTAAEAIQQSVSWLPLLARECHPDARLFLCSLFAPVCLDRYGGGAPRRKGRGPAQPGPALTTQICSSPRRAPLCAACWWGRGTEKACCQECFRQREAKGTAAIKAWESGDLWPGPTTHPGLLNKTVFYRLERGGESGRVRGFKAFSPRRQRCSVCPRDPGKRSNPGPSAGLVR